MKKHNKHRIDNQPAYRKWVKARDSALEDLLNRAQAQTGDVLRMLLGRVLEVSKAYYYDMQNGGLGAHLYEDHMKRIFSEATFTLVNIMMNLRATSFTLAKSSEAEIIAQLVKSPAHPITTKLDRSHIQKIKDKETLAGGSVFDRTKMYCDRLRRKIESQAHMAAMNSPDLETFLQTVVYAFPKRRIVKRPKRALKPALMEAEGDEKPKVDYSINFIDDQEWNQMLRDYGDEYIPEWRQPEYVVDIPISDPEIAKNADPNDIRYAWEFERDMTNDFVSAVRDGQIEAATDNGITDFVWIAVIDSVTDECCAWRDSLLVSEIEEQLGDHESEDDECDTEGDGLTPPLHFNCRCTLAPALDNIPDQPDDGSKEFADWLET